MLGGARAQYHLRQAYFYLDMRQVIKREVFIAYARQKFDENGRLLDQPAREFISTLLESLVELARRTRDKEGSGARTAPEPGAGVFLLENGGLDRGKSSPARSQTPELAPTGAATGAASA
jgi:hypothetical protein